MNSGCILMGEILQQGLIFSLVTLAVYLTSRVIRFDDLTVEGSFSVGGAVAAVWLMEGKMGAIAFPLALGAGGIAGAITGFLHIRLGLNPLLAGICTTTAAFSVNLALAGAHVALPLGQRPIANLPLLLVATFTALLTVKWLLTTDFGFLMRASGENPLFVRRLGKDPGLYKLGALILANALTALAGALFVVFAGFFSITGSMGILVGGLASLILGTLFSSRVGPALILGTVLYQGSFALAVELGVDPLWNSLIKASLIVILMQVGIRRKLCSS